MRTMVRMKSQRHLLEMVHALHPPRRFSSGLGRRQQQRNKDGDDGDHHQKLN